jgi:hypothetical protein
MIKFSLIKPVVDFLSKPSVKKTATEVARMAVKEAGVKAGINAVNKTANAIGNTPKKVEAFFDRKKDQYLREVLAEAEVFFQKQTDILEKKVDRKITEIEKRLDEQIQKELKIKLQILIYTMIAIILVGLFSLGYFTIKKAVGL